MENLKNFSKAAITEVHGDVDIYRKLYDGHHSELFERAKNLIRNGEITDRIENGAQMAKNVRTPYIVANVSKVIVDIPELFISRSLGDIKTNYPINEEESDDAYTAGTTHLEMTSDDFDTPFDLQQDTLDQIADNSNLSRQHSMNLKQWQIDGAIVLIPEIINGQVKLTFKERNIYYELDDGKTYQLRYFKKIGKKEYVHVHEEVEGERSLNVNHKVYSIKGDSDLTLVEDEDIIMEVTGIPADQRNVNYEGRKRKFFEYLPYNPTFTNPFGRSALAEQAGKQDEINWTITRASQTFERNGKPRISVSSSIMDELVNISQERYGTDYNFDHRDLEVTEMDSDGNSLVIHQIDVSKIGDIPYVKEIIRIMFMETQTSEQSVDFLREGTSSAQSGIAKFYDMLISVMKAEKLRDEYVAFIERGVESCLWLLKRNNEEIIVEKPSITQKEVIPVTSKEVAEENIIKYKAGAQSLETTVRNINPGKSEVWILDEVADIEAGKVSQDSMSLLRGNMTATNFNDNKPIDATTVVTEEQTTEDTE